MSRILLMICLVMCIAQFGCASKSVYQPRPMYDPAAVAGETYSVNPPQLVTSTEVLRRSPAGQQTWANPPWWAVRNDAYLNPRTSDRVGDVVDYSVRTYDRQYSHHGHVHDYYRRDVRSIHRGRVSY